MVEAKNIYLKQNQGFQAQQRDGLLRSVAWLQLFTLATGLCLSKDDMALAQVNKPNALDNSGQNSSTYLLPAGANFYNSALRSHLNNPTPSLFKPHSVRFSASRLSPNSSSLPPSLASPMQPPVFPPTTAIVAPAPKAATPESLVYSATPNPSSDSPSNAAGVIPNQPIPKGYNSLFIDPTGYKIGATQSAPDVVFADRSGGCQITVPATGNASPAACGIHSQTRRPTIQASKVATSGIQIGPVNISQRGVSLGNTLVISREQLNARLNPLNLLRRGQEQYLFPLSIPTSISSLFGWRMHPIEHDWRFHSGTDLAAPIGTPVLATRAGRVAVSDFVGGYGLMVILRHNDSNLESRYAHLSQVSVRPGEWVEQGEVIGLVGSTGNSTGPHLHFEMRQLTNQGWVAMDPMEVLQYGLANLLKVIDNPILALSKETPTTAEDTKTDGPVDLPFRPAQPNAS